MVKLADGKHNPCYLNIRMRWNETLKLGFQSCIRPWHNSIQAGFPMANAVARAPLTIEIQNPWWVEMVAVETLNMRMTNPCSLFLFLYCFLGYTTRIDPPSKIRPSSSFIEYTIQVRTLPKRKWSIMFQTVFLFFFGEGWGGRYWHFFNLKNLISIQINEWKF
jgi:hypothetical protein